MKIIKRKSAVKPITGSIVDTTNIDDKTSNTYSANVIDNKLAGEKYYKSGSLIFTKQDNFVHIYSLNATEDVGTFINNPLPEKYRPTKQVFIPCVYITTSWYSMIGRLDIATDGTIQVRQMKTANYGNNEYMTTGYVLVSGTYRTD